jgi:hypothetical protein
MLIYVSDILERSRHELLQKLVVIVSKYGEHNDELFLVVYDDMVDTPQVKYN